MLPNTGDDNDLRILLDCLYKKAVKDISNNFEPNQLSQFTKLSLKQVWEQGNRAILEGLVTVDYQGETTWLIRINDRGIKKLKELENVTQKKVVSNVSKNRLKIPSLTWIPISVLIIGIFGIVLTYGNVIFPTDSQITPIHTAYLMSDIIKTEDNGKHVLLAVPFFFKMNGTIYFDTTSRSVQNPIHIQMNFTPYGLERPSSPQIFAEILPSSLHYIFSNATNYPKDPNDVTVPKQAKIELLKKSNPLHYEGNGTIVYENEGLQHYHLAERDTMLRGTWDNATIPFEYDLKNNKSKIFIAELENSGDPSITIGPLTQTSSLASNKATLVVSFLGMIVSALGGSIFTILYDHRKNKSL